MWLRKGLSIGRYRVLESAWLPNLVRRFKQSVRLGGVDFSVVEMLLISSSRSPGLRTYHLMLGALHYLNTVV